MPPTLDEIETSVSRTNYRGYRERDLARADKLPEPRRSAELRQLHEWAKSELAADHERYLHYVAKLAIRRQDPNDPAGADESPWDELYTALSLKYCHLFNDFAHLRTLREMLERQPSLV